MPIRWKILDPERRSFFAQGKYSLKYPKDKTVKAAPGTLGIMVFDTLKNAKSFRSDAFEAYPIVKIKTIGRGKKQPNVCRFISRWRIDAFYNQEEIGCLAPPGTICYPAVEVLE